MNYSQAAALAQALVEDWPIMPANAEEEEELTDWIMTYFEEEFEERTID